MLKAHTSDSKIFSWRILQIFLADQTPLVILFNRMTSPLKLLLCSNTSNSKWILVKLTLHLWQVANTNSQVEKLLQSLLTKSLSNFISRNFVFSLSNLHRVLYVTLIITSDIVENAKFSITSYGIHLLTPQRVSDRLSLKSIITLSVPSRLSWLSR